MRVWTVAIGSGLLLRGRRRPASVRFPRPRLGLPVKRRRVTKPASLAAKFRRQPRSALALSSVSAEQAPQLPERSRSASEPCHVGSHRWSSSARTECRIADPSRKTRTGDVVKSAENSLGNRRGDRCVEVDPTAMADACSSRPVTAGHVPAVVVADRGGDAIGTETSLAVEPGRGARSRPEEGSSASIIDGPPRSSRERPARPTCRR